MKTILIRNTVILIGLIALCMLSFLSMLIYFNIQKRYCDLRDSSVQFIASDVIAVIEKGLNLGLRCDEMQNIPSILQKQSNIAPFIKGLATYNKKGDLLYTTVLLMDSLIPEPILQQCLIDTSNKPILTKSNSIGKLYIPVKNTFGITDIIVSLYYERFSKHEFSNLKFYFILVVLILSVAITLLSIIPLKIIFKPVNTSLFSFSVIDDDQGPDGIDGKEIITHANEEIEYLINDIKATEATTKAPEYFS